MQSFCETFNSKDVVLSTLGQVQWNVQKIKLKVGALKLISLTFDGGSTLCSKSVYEFMVSFVDNHLELKTKCTSNFRMRGSHAVDDVCLLIARVVYGRLGDRKPNYFVSDSAPFKKSAVRKLMVNAGGEDY